MEIVVLKRIPEAEKSIQELTWDESQADIRNPLRYLLITE